MDLNKVSCDVLPSSCDVIPISDYLHDFFKEFIDPEATRMDEALREEMPTTTVKPSNVCRLSKSLMFQEELSEGFCLALRFHNRQYYVHISECKQNLSSNEQIPSRKNVIMDINTWYEFQYKILAFNLKYKSASFVANNIILVLNKNNSDVYIKNLKNYCSIDLNNHQLGRLKELAYNLNVKLIYQMYNERLPIVIKNKCKISKLSIENDAMSKLMLCIEKNIVDILNRIYECHGCIVMHASQSLHACLMFNNLEKFQQLGDMILMLVDLNLVGSMFCNEVANVSEEFLSTINMETIKNGLFKTEIKNEI